MKDISKSEVIEILISEDGKTVWINGEDGICIFRACRIKSLILNDERKTKTHKTKKKFNLSN